MAHLKIRGVPWSIYPSSDSSYDAGGYIGWHQGQQVMSDRATYLSEAKTMDGITWWGDEPSSEGDMLPSKIFGTGGATSAMINGKRHNVVYLLGTYTNHSSFTNSSFTYPSDARSSMMRNVIGFGCRNTCAGSHSDEGGNAQAWVEKVGLFYAHPDTGKRSTFLATEKLSGSHNINTKYPNSNQYHYAYRIKSGNIKTVHDDELVFMGMAIQFIHDTKASKHTSRCTLKDMRIICGENENKLFWQTTTSIMLIDDKTRTLAEHANGHALEVAY